MKINRKFIKNILVFLFYFIYQYISLFIIFLLNIKLNTNTDKIIYTFIVNMIYLLLIIFIYRKELLLDIKKINIKDIIKYIPIYLFGVFLMIISNILVSKITNSTIPINEQKVREYIKLFPIYMCFSTIIYAPIVEEITFRKTFRNIIKNNYIFILISGILFGIAHLSFNGNILNNFLMIIPYILMGIDLSYIYYKSKNIFTTIIIHSMHNLILIIIQFIGG